LDPWPAAYSYLEGELLKIAATHVEPGSDAEPGEIIAADKSGVRIACGQGMLVVGELQLPGKKRLAAMNFLSGRPLFPGTRLG
jgi:methionyl-tRNA formyltransferase